VNDPHRKPGPRDRDPLAARIRRAAEQGRIGTADRDIRLGNVASAQSMAELDLIGRELDQLETTLAAGQPVNQSVAQPVNQPLAAATAWTGAASAPAEEIAEQAVDVAKATARSIGVVTVLILVLALGGVGVATLLAFGGSSGSSGSSVSSETGGLFEPAPVESGEPAAEPSAPGEGYALTGPGIRWFLAEYRAKFSTSVVVELVMYGDYAVVQVPQPGGRRHAGFSYRPASGWTDFGGVTANTPGTEPVDLQGLDVRALARNIARARRTLNVEDPTMTYVIVRHHSTFDPAPSVDIHVMNEFKESGYLATTMDGTVERAYPFAP
jgi:hypothetical protein